MEQSNGWVCFGVRVIRGGPSYGYPFYSDPNRFTHNMALIQLATFEDQSMTGTFLEEFKERLVNTLMGCDKVGCLMLDMSALEVLNIPLTNIVEMIRDALIAAERFCTKIQLVWTPEVPEPQTLLDKMWGEA